MVLGMAEQVLGTDRVQQGAIIEQIGHNLLVIPENTFQLVRFLGLGPRRDKLDPVNRCWSK